MQDLSFLRPRALAAVSLALLLAVTPVWPQTASQAPAQPMADLPMVRSLRVLALAGNGELNDLGRKVMAPLVVQVLDGNGRPVEGAQVVFRFPPQGPGVLLPGGKGSLTALTNADGQARAAGWAANAEVGTFPIRVTATKANEFGEATLSMTNVASAEVAAKAKKKGWLNSKWGRIALIAGAGAAAGIAVAATRGGNGPAASAPGVVVIPGAPTVGGR